jgi:replication factor C subunit 1
VSITPNIYVANELFTDHVFYRYNQQSHPMPFMKSSQVLAPKKGATKEKPDLEEALDESEDEAPADDADVKAEDDLEGDLSKDKYVKAPKKGKKAAAADDDDDDEDVKPAKAKGKAPAKSRAKK